MKGHLKFLWNINCSGGTTRVWFTFSQHFRSEEPFWSKELFPSHMMISYINSIYNLSFYCLSATTTLGLLLDCWNKTYYHAKHAAFHWSTIRGGNSGNPLTVVRDNNTIPTVNTQSWRSNRERLRCQRSPVTRIF